MKSAGFAPLAVLCLVRGALCADGVPAGCPADPAAPLWSMSVRAMTQGHVTLGNLRARNFTLLEQGAPRAVCAITHARQPSSIGILLDTSASMALPLDRLATASALAHQLLETSGPQDEYFLQYATDQPTQPASFTREREAIRAGLQVSPAGTTALLDAIEAALGAMHGAHHRNRALLVISDAFDNASSHNVADLEQALARFPVPLFLAVPAGGGEHSGEGQQVSARENAAREALSQLAARSGGLALEIADKRAMIRAATQFASSIRFPYQLYFRRPAGSPGRAGEVRVGVRGLRPVPLLFYHGVPRHAE